MVTHQTDRKTEGIGSETIRNQGKLTAEMLLALQPLLLNDIATEANNQTLLSFVFLSLSPDSNCAVGTASCTKVKSGFQEQEGSSSTDPHDGHSQN